MRQSRGVDHHVCDKAKRHLQRRNVKYISFGLRYNLVADPHSISTSDIEIEQVARSELGGEAPMYMAA